MSMAERVLDSMRAMSWWLQEYGIMGRMDLAWMFMDGVPRVPLWIADQARNDRPGCILTIDSRLRGNDGVVGLSCYHPHPSPLPSRERGSVGCFVLLFLV